MRNSLLLFSLITTSLSASFYSQEKIGCMRLSCNGNGFFVVKNGKEYKVESSNLDKQLRMMTPEQKILFLKKGHFKIHEIDGNYFIEASGKLKGGGPVSGAIAYWVTKTLCYGTAVAAAGTAVIATGGVGAITGAIATAGTLGATAGASVAAGAIAGAGLTGTATVATAGVITGAGSLAAAAAAVETASLSVSFAFTICPFLP